MSTLSDARLLSGQTKSATIVTVSATKGGVGKTTIAYELAAALGGVLVDLDWDEGGATQAWGYGAQRTAPLIDALENGPSGRPPKPRHRPHQPALVPSHPDLAACTVTDGLIVDCLEAWAQQWAERFPYLVVDTHPGSNPYTDAAMAAAHVIVSPVVLAPKEMAATAELVRLFGHHPLILAPNMVGLSPPTRFVDQLEAIAAAHPSLTVAEPISRHNLLGRRIRRSALVLQPNPGRAVSRAADEFRALAAVVANHG
ncbi:MAG: ParA family protein [Actinomycetota bacterium]|nr:ParA family protein [Actinomycetota bacterium]